MRVEKKSDKSAKNFWGGKLRVFGPSGASYDAGGFRKRSRKILKRPRHAEKLVKSWKMEMLRPRAAWKMMT